VLHSGWVSPTPVFWIFMEQGKIMEAEVPTVRVGATPTGLTNQIVAQPLSPIARGDLVNEGVKWNGVDNTTRISSALW